MIEPKVTIGILHTTALSFYLQGSFQSAEGIVSGQQHAMLKKGAIFWNGKTYQELEFTPIEDDATFQLHNVLIGIAFHWQRHEHQTFQGKLKLMIEHQQIVAINQIDVEQYLLSVISSEMSAHA
ncbi:MAG: SpoIID/LytB domain-containing protein, partial [Bacteroidales bacterium]|nr:SpoIID/LytB domain-containing protein [Candidatus Minthousia equi]